MKRRHFLKHLSACTGMGLLSSQIATVFAWAQQGLARPQFLLFVFARGGWDTTMVFDPKLGVGGIDSAPDSELTEDHGLVYIRNPKQPSVERFFKDFGHLCCFINGVNTQSISHFLGRESMLTGDIGAGLPDWPSLIASRAGANLQLPNMAISGPSFAGNLGRYTYSGSGFLSLLLSDGTEHVPGPATAALLSSYQDVRFQDFLDMMNASGRTGRRLDEIADAYTRIQELKAIRNDLGDEFQNVGSLHGDAIALCSSMQKGYAITGTVDAPGEWDSHDNNFPLQYDGYETLFDGLHRIVSYLAGQDATAGSGTLLDQTTLVVLSEMGRTPRLNGTAGKDHWQFTTSLLIGSGVKGARIFGGTDDRQNGLLVDYQTGAASPQGAEIKPANLGAALLLLAGVNPADVMDPGIVPFRAFLEAPV